MDEGRGTDFFFVLCSGGGVASRLPKCPDVNSCDFTYFGAIRSREGGNSYLQSFDFGWQPLPFSLRPQYLKVMAASPDFHFSRISNSFICT